MRARKHAGGLARNAHPRLSAGMVSPQDGHSSGLWRPAPFGQRHLLQGTSMERDGSALVCCLLLLFAAVYRRLRAVYCHIAIDQVQRLCVHALIFSAFRLALCALPSTTTTPTTRSLYVKSTRPWAPPQPGSGRTCICNTSWPLASTTMYVALQLLDSC